MASGLAGKPSAFVSSDVAFDGEPIVGSFTVDGLTFAVIDESRVELVGVAPSVALSGGSEAGVVEGPDEGHASLILPESVTYEGATYALVSIGAFAFYLSGVTDVTLPASVADVDERAFRSSDVARADVDQANPALSSYDGALYSADTTRILLVPEGRSGQLRIPSRAASLLPEAFSHCASLEGFAVDAGCPAFSSGDGILYDGSGETLLRVAPGAAEATIREGCTTIAAGALEACAKLTTINAPASVTSISPDIFHAVPTVSLPAASAILSEGNEAAGAEGSEAEGSNDGQAGEASTQLTAMVALSSTDDGLPTIDPAGIMVSLLEGAAVDIWETRGFRVAGSFDPSASTIATLQSAESYAAGIVVYGNGGGVNVWRGKGVGGATTVDPASVVTLASGASQYAWPENTAQVWNNRIDMWSAGNVYYYSLTPARTGYRFTGWTGAVTVSASATSPVTTTSGNIYANWTANSYTVEYWNKAGTTKLSSDTGFKYDTARNLAAKPTTGVNAGYTAVGWAASANQSAKAYDFGSSQKNLAASGTKKLYLAETANTITLTWNSQGGSAVSNTSKAYAPGAKVPMSSSNPTKAGYTFKGWYTAASGGTQITSNTALPTSNATYHAQWTKKTSHAVTLNKNNGTGGTSTVYYWPDKGYTTSSTSTTVIASGSVLVSSLPTRAGYTFAGYYSAASGGTQYVDSSGKRTTSAPALTAAATWHAHWTKKTSHAVTLDKNNGTGGTSTVYYWPDKGYTTSSTSTTVIASGSVLVSSLPTRAGYTFVGYYSAASGGMQYVDSSGKRTTSAPALTTAATWHAQWTANTITLTWNSQGGSAVGSTSKVYASGVKVPMPASNPTKAGYSFKGWFTATSGGTQVTSNTALPTSNATYYAQWNANTITLTWNSQGGSAVSNTSATYSPTAKVPMPATTSRSGYTFAGWWTSATGGTQVTASTALPTSNKTYYAHWSLNPYAIAYDLAGGAVSGNPTTYDVTTTTFTLKNPTRTGYAFAGWSGTGLTGSANKTVTIAKGSTGNRAYTAHWSKNAYDVTFDAAGGAVWGAPTWTPDSPKITFDSGSWNVVTVAERSGYTFKGWYTAASGGAQIYAPQGDGTAASVSDGTYWKNGAWVYPGNMVFYAQWEGNAISLTWDTQDGNAPASTHQVYADSAKLAVPSDPMRTGYIFQGWYTASSGGTRVSASTPLPVASTTYFAHWAPALSADIPVEVEARVDVLGMEEQEPATGCIESRCGEPLKVAEVSMEPLTGATELFGAGNESQVQLQALAGQGAVWQPGGANASFAFPLGSSATEADPAKLAPLCMAKYGDRVPVSYRFSIPEALLATLTETTKPVCSVAYTVALA